MTITPLRTMTFEEYLALPEGEELRHAEFIDGEVIENRPHGLHQRMQLQMAFELERACPPGHEVLTEWDWVTRPGPASGTPTCSCCARSWSTRPAWSRHHCSPSRCSRPTP